MTMTTERDELGGTGEPAATDQAHGLCASCATDDPFAAAKNDPSPPQDSLASVPSMNLPLRIVLMSAVLLALIGCGRSEVGEPCTRKGETYECVEGAICDTEKDNTIVCLKLCESDADCASTESCGGVSGGTRKACHPK